MLGTIAICTLNHAESLRRTLQSFVAMQLPGDLTWEILVVNNNCTDHTDEVISAFAEELPIRREFELHHGLSRARNRAVEVAQGDYRVEAVQFRRLDQRVHRCGTLAAAAIGARRSFPTSVVRHGLANDIINPH